MAARQTPPTVNEQDLRDLGFGSVVSRESRTRLVNRDGSFNVERSGLSFWQYFSPYHFMLTIPWWQFFAIITGTYLLTNALFALGFHACGPDALGTAYAGLERHTFLRSFFFSVQTLSTIGYGQVYPVGLAANILVTFEALSGLIGFAIVTGLLFARFSRPNAKLLFSHHALVAPYRGITALEFRVGNALRHNELIEATAKVLFTKFEDADGVRTRRYYPLPLERERVTFLPLTWTVVHPIDENSPIYGETLDTMRENQAEVIVLLSGLDETIAAKVNQRTSYTPDEILWGGRFANAFLIAETRGGKVTFDMRKFDAVERVPLPEPALKD
jgi:inward rectifier potassium channel